ncbi:MAG: hypothetical protein IKW01_02775 [Firmicutes bacterium]|nr:hypothetical protein [Bacillota bacterium]
MVMMIYTSAALIAAIVAGLVLAIRTKKAEDVVYTKLDKAGRITNIFLLIAYLVSTPICFILAAISGSGETGILAIIGWIISFIIGSFPLFCGIGLGLSVKWRKQGKSRQSFMVQFAGLLGIALTIGLYGLCAGNLVASLN